MQIVNVVFIALAVASFTSALNTVQLGNQDGNTRHIVFTSEASLNLAHMPELVIAGHTTVTQTFPVGWIGNFYSYNQGTANMPGYLGEVEFDGPNGLTYFDVSAIVNPNDRVGVKYIHPVGLSTPNSGCNTSVGTCLNQYNAPTDIATQSISSHALVCLLGNP